MDDQTNDSVKIESLEAEKKEEETKTGDHVKEKRRTKEEKSKKKDDKRTAEQILKGLNNVHSVEDKLEIMCKKYSELVDENRKLQLTLKQYDKKMLILQCEKEQFQSERSKAALTRRRLESLCRELQKQKKAIQEENFLRIREQEESRKELSEKFQGSLAQLTTLLNKNMEKNTKLFEENLEMKQKFKSVFEQLELKERQLLKVHNQVKLDLEISDAKLAKVKVDATAEKEALLKEKQQLLYKLTEYQVQIRELQATEVALRSQISMYTDKYDEFQNTLARSNKVYGEFNEEIVKMSKKILTLEQETTLWKQRWENTRADLLKMAAEKQVRDSEMATLNKKLSLLQDLCKMFQCERTNLLAQLKEKEKANELIKNEESNAQDGATAGKAVDETTKDCTPTVLEEVQTTASKSSDTVPKEKDAVDNILAEQKIELKETAEMKNEIKEENVLKGNQIEDCKEENTEQIIEKTTEVTNKEIAEDKPVSDEKNEEVNIYLNSTETDPLQTASSEINQDIDENVGLLKQMNLLVEQMSATTNSEIELLDMEIKTEMPDNVSGLPDRDQIVEVQLTEEINLSASNVKDVDGSKEDALPSILVARMSNDEPKQSVVDLKDEKSCANNSIQQEDMPLEIQEIIAESDMGLSRLNPKQNGNDTSAEVELHNNVAQVSNTNVQENEHCEVIKTMIDSIVNGETQAGSTDILKTDDKSGDDRATDRISIEGGINNTCHSEESEKESRASCTLSDEIPAEIGVPSVQHRSEDVNGEIKNDAEVSVELIASNITHDDPGKEISIATDAAQTNVDAERSKAAPIKNAKRKKK
ncbi:hypothetical protein KM043_004119 [Ampulex compressa]|nr:hypothetical protein KM043_004119 [Ampulex compressa]